MGTKAPGDPTAFVENVGGRLRQALLAASGPEVGAEATAEALAYAREHWERIKLMDNPLGDLYRGSQGKPRWYRNRPLRLPDVPEASAPWVEPGLPKVLSKLARRQRVAVVLCHGYGRTRDEVAELLGGNASTVQRHLDRGVAKLRRGLAVEEGPMRDVTDQLVAYAEILDQAAPALDELAAASPTAPRALRRFQPRAIWAVAAGALAVLVVVGGIAALSRRTTTTTAPPVDTTSATATVPVPAVSIELINPRAVTPTMFEWEHPFAGPGGVAVVEGTFHMLSAAYGDGVATVAYAASSDGVVWAQGANRPVLDLSSAPWAPLEFDHALPRSLVVDDDGVWHLHFEISWLDRASDQFRSSIGRATTRDPAGIWVFDRDPVLRADNDVVWRSKRVGSPSVIVEGGEFVMLFVGAGAEGGVVGRATSTDGFVWDVDPDPVLAASSDWEGDEIARVDLVRFDGGYAMVFAGSTTSRRGLAVSADGVSWFSHPENPVLTTADLPEASVFDSEFVAEDAGLVGFIENGSVRSDSAVVVLQIDVDLKSLLEALADR